MITQTTTKTERVREPSRAFRSRTCVGCGQRVVVGSGSADLVRLLLAPGGEVAVDTGRRGIGRGAHVHPRRVCLEKASARGLARAAKGRIDRVVTENGREALCPDVLAGAVRSAIDLRIRGLLAVASRSRQVALGTDAVAEATRQGEAHAVVVACDAAATIERVEVSRAVAEGRAVAWGTKVLLASLCPGGTEAQSGELSVVSISSKSIAAAVRDAARAADACGVVSVNVVERGA